MIGIKIIEIKGVGPAYARKLFSIGITTSNSLLINGKTPEERKEISEKSKISETLILKWVHFVDLLRIKGIEIEFSELLESLGIYSIDKLAQQSSETLWQTMCEVNNKKNMIKRIPTLREIEDWVLEAKKITKLVSYSSIKQIYSKDESKDLEYDISEEDHLQIYLHRLRLKQSQTNQNLKNHNISTDDFQKKLEPSLGLIRIKNLIKI